MKDTHHSEVGTEELDLLEILREVYRRKWVIVAVTVLSACAAALISYRQPDVYEASAALMIREPTSAIDRNVDENTPPDESPVISVETLQMLTESTSTMRILFDSLWEQKKLEMQSSVTLAQHDLERERDELHRLQVELEKRRAVTAAG